MCMVMYVVEGHFGSFYAGHQMKEAVGPGQIVCADCLDYTVPYLRRPQFQILILYIFHTLCQFVTKNFHISHAIHSPVNFMLYFGLSKNVSQEI